MNWEPERLSASQRRDLMEIIEERHGRSSTLITSQLPVDAWHEVIGDPTFADAILDRVVHNAYRLTLNGPSMRKTQAARAAEADAQSAVAITANARPAKGGRK
jgi:DNA replication protein DnaC